MKKTFNIPTESWSHWFENVVVVVCVGGGEGGGLSVRFV